MAEEEEIEELRRRKMLELRAKLEEQQRQAEQRRQYEIQKKLAILQIMTPEARSRLAIIPLAKPCTKRITIPVALPNTYVCRG